MRPIPIGEYGSHEVLRQIRRERDERRARFRARWWFPLLVVTLVASSCWGALKVDQLIAEKLIWPSTGAQFVEVGPVPNDPSATGGRIMIVAAGLNRKSGTSVAAALMPSLTVGNTRVFSLIYGSGINDQDIEGKFDALIEKVRPSEVSFFGSSMGGDVVLNLAAHTQRLRQDYRIDLQASSANDAGAAATASGAEASSSSGSTPVGERSSGPGRVVGAQVSRIIDMVGLRIHDPATEIGSAALHALPGAGFDTGRAGSSSIRPDQPVVPPRLGRIFLDCTPLGAADVRDSNRTKADALTGLSEALGTDGGAAVRMTAEIMAQQHQWSTGRFPFLQIRFAHLRYKVEQVWREKIDAPGISTQLVKDQYSVIRRTDIDDIVEALGPGTDIVYFLPENRSDDYTVDVGKVETELRKLASENKLNLRIVAVPDGHHASAENNSAAYREAIDAINRGGA